MTSKHSRVENTDSSPRFWAVMIDSLRPTAQQLGTQGSRELRRQLGELRQTHLATQARLSAFRASSVEKNATLQLDTGRAHSVAALASGHTQT